MIPLFAKGIKNDGLKMDDIFQCSTEEDTRKGVDKLARNWTKDKCAKNPSFAWTLFRTYARRFALPLTLYVFQVMQKTN